VESKGVGTLIRAFAQVAAGLQGVRLIVIGSGSEELRLRQLVETLGLRDRITFAGRLLNSELPIVYQSADIAVVPSEPSPEGAEPWGLVVNEAMASGCAVVVSDAVGAAAHGLPRDKVSGFTFPAGDISALSALLSSLARSEDLRAICGANARKHVRQLTHDSMARAIAAAVAHGSNHEFVEPFVEL